MIQIKGLSKSFGDIEALSDMTATIQDGSIFGLIGSNGSGKSTLLRLLAGIYMPDSGSIQFDGNDVFEDVDSKARFFYISDDQFTKRNATMQDMAAFYRQIYSMYDMDYFEQLTKQFQLAPNRPLKTFSKGMQRQAHIILALASHPQYLFCDETFDGLDPVKRQAVKRIFAEAVAEKRMSVIISSHNLREIEDICDQIGLLHDGKIVLQRNIDDITHDLHKVQCAFSTEKGRGDFSDLDMLHFERRGRMVTMIVRGDRVSALKAVEKQRPLYAEVLPLTLEEVFITEMEVRGYDVDTLIF